MIKNTEIKTMIWIFPFPYLKFPDFLCHVFFWQITNPACLDQYNEGVIFGPK